VDRRNRRQVVGVLRRGDIVHAYSHALVDKHQREHLMERLRIESQIGVQLVQIDLTAGDAAVGQLLREAGLPPDCVVESIYRGGRVVVPRGDTRLWAGDRVTALAGKNTVESLRAALHAGGAAPADALRAGGGEAIPGDSAQGGDAILDELTAGVERPQRAQAGQRDASTGAGVNVREVTVQAGAACVGQRIDKVGWPRASVIASLRRGPTILVPHGDTVLQAGDVLIVVAEGAAAEATQRLCGE
jgi:Trk K+ transport system NAD-binding subunit